MTENKFLIKLHALAISLEKNKNIALDTEQLRELCFSQQQFLTPTEHTLNFLGKLADFIEHHYPAQELVGLLQSLSIFYLELIHKTPINIFIIATPGNIQNIKDNIRSKTTRIKQCVTVGDEHSIPDIITEINNTPRCVVIYDSASKKIYFNIRPHIQNNILNQLYYSYQRKYLVDMERIVRSLDTIRVDINKVKPEYVEQIGFWKKTTQLPLHKHKIIMGKTPATFLPDLICIDTQHTDYTLQSFWLQQLHVQNKVQEVVVPISFRKMVRKNFTDIEEATNFYLVYKNCIENNAAFEDNYEIESIFQPFYSLIESILFYSEDYQNYLIDFQRTLDAIILSMNVTIHSVDLHSLNETTAKQHSDLYKYSDFFSENTTALSKMVESGIPLLFIILPVPEDYKNKLDNELISLTRNFFKNINNENVRCLDLTADNDFNHTFLPDGNINNDGYKLLAENITHFIRETTR